MMNWIGIGIGGIALTMLLLQLADMQLKMIRQQEIMRQAMRIRWICRPAGCVEIQTDWDAIMEKNGSGKEGGAHSEAVKRRQKFSTGTL